MPFTGKSEIFLNSTIENTPFYPALSVGDFQRIYRVPAERAPEAVAMQLRLARNKVNHSLKTRLSEWTQQGYESLVFAAEGEQVDYIAYYLDAVFCKAKAELLTDFETFTRKESAEKTAAHSEEVRQSLLAKSNQALRQLLNINTRITAELL